MTQPDFEALRAERNAAHAAWVEKMATEGWVFHSTFNDHGCYCDCANGGPCEHEWDGKPYESSDGSMWSATCSKCETTAMSHSLRCAA